MALGKNIREDGSTNSNRWQLREDQKNGSRKLRRENAKKDSLKARRRDYKGW